MKTRDEDNFQSNKLNFLSRAIAEQMLHLNARVSGRLDDVRVLQLAVVVQRVQVVDHDGIAEQLRENVSPDQMRRDFLEEIFLVLVDLVGLAARRALVRGIHQRTRRHSVEYFLVELLEIVDIQVWYLLHNA